MMEFNWLNTQSYVQLPQGDIPVMAEVAGERVQVGVGRIDAKTGIFTTFLNESGFAQMFVAKLQMDEMSYIPVGVSEVEFVPGMTDGKVETNDSAG